MILLGGYIAAGALAVAWMWAAYGRPSFGAALIIVAIWPALVIWELTNGW